ncbi:hypothetical protein L211DRAFT_849592 [Terfezia boudieri ATCC MYA-4762]|uniref:Uncharacterized protein n=1 Tax=Terfezia boudieri ATCC MYA-4762 TaxID=1051890 RepID=A0A3N4LQR3_9PEZI|nr:hypothetical protein L211DRAFT_849592 [Terfezia boudieri ATCC MYA-4762]
MNVHKLIEVGQKLREAEDMKKKVEEELASSLEKTVGKTRQVVVGEVFKTVRIVIGHMQPIDLKGKTELEEAVEKVNNMLRMKGLAEGIILWMVTTSAGRGEFNDESIWEVKKVKEGTNPVEVCGEIGKALMVVFGRTGDILNIWVDDLKSVRLMVPAALMLEARGRKALAEKIRGENKELKTAKRYPKLWGKARVTGFTFDAENIEKAKKIIKLEILWKGKRRRVGFFEQEALQKATQKMGASKISRKGDGGQEGQRKKQYEGAGSKKGKVVDEEGFELVESSKEREDIRIMEVVAEGEEEEFSVKSDIDIKSDWHAEMEEPTAGPFH